jgi:hypothetical protein
MAFGTASLPNTALGSGHSQEPAPCTGVTLPAGKSNMNARQPPAALHALRLRPRLMKHAFYTLEGPSQDDRGRGPL